MFTRDLMVVAYSPLRTKTKATCCSWSLADCEGCGYPVGSRDSERVVWLSLQGLSSKLHICEASPQRSSWGHVILKSVAKSARFVQNRIMVFCTWLKSVFLDLPAISWLNKSAKIGRYVLWAFTLTALNYSERFLWKSNVTTSPSNVGRL
ncbi:hypothetical protein EMCRGX_G001832 [Ephydatia muelleri]